MRDRESVEAEDENREARGDKSKEAGRRNGSEAARGKGDTEPATGSALHSTNQGDAEKVPPPSNRSTKSDSRSDTESERGNGKDNDDKRIVKQSGAAKATRTGCDDEREEKERVKERATTDASHPSEGAVSDRNYERGGIRRSNSRSASRSSSRSTSRRSDASMLSDGEQKERSLKEDSSEQKGSKGRNTPGDNVDSSSTHQKDNSSLAPTKGNDVLSPSSIGKGHLPAELINGANAQSILNVTQLSRNINEAHLLELFGIYGGVKSVHSIVDKQMNLPKGYAYVEMEDRKGAEEARAHMKGAQLDGRYIQVEFLLLPESRTPNKDPHGVDGGPTHRHGPRQQDDDVALLKADLINRDGERERLGDRDKGGHIPPYRGGDPTYRLGPGMGEQEGAGRQREGERERDRDQGRDRERLDRERDAWGMGGPSDRTHRWAKERGAQAPHGGAAGSDRLYPRGAGGAYLRDRERERRDSSMPRDKGRSELGRDRDRDHHWDGRDDWRRHRPGEGGMWEGRKERERDFRAKYDGDKGRQRTDTGPRPGSGMSDEDGRRRGGDRGKERERDRGVPGRHSRADRARGRQQAISSVSPRSRLRRSPLSKGDKGRPRRASSSASTSRSRSKSSSSNKSRGRIPRRSGGGSVSSSVSSDKSQGKRRRGDPRSAKGDGGSRGVEGVQRRRSGGDGRRTSRPSSPAMKDVKPAPTSSGTKTITKEKESERNKRGGEKPREKRQRRSSSNSPSSSSTSSPRRSRRPPRRSVSSSSRSSSSRSRSKGRRSHPPQRGTVRGRAGPVRRGDSRGQRVRPFRGDAPMPSRPYRRSRSRSRSRSVSRSRSPHGRFNRKPYHGRGSARRPPPHTPAGRVPRRPVSPGRRKRSLSSRSRSRGSSSSFSRSQSRSRTASRSSSRGRKRTTVASREAAGRSGRGRGARGGASGAHGGSRRRPTASSGSSSSRSVS